MEARLGSEWPWERGDFSQVRSYSRPYLAHRLEFSSFYTATSCSYSQSFFFLRVLDGIIF